MKNSFLPKKVAKYRWNSVFGKYMLILFSAFVIIFSIMSAVIIGDIEKQRQNETELILEKNKVNFETILTSIESSIQSSNSLFQSTSYILDLIHSNDVTLPRVQNAYGKFSEMLRFTSFDSGYLSSIYIYSPKSDYVFSFSSPIFVSNNVSTFGDMHIFNNYIKTNKTILFRKIHKTYSTYPYLTYIFPLSYANKTYGYIAYNIDFSMFLNSLSLPIHIISSDNQILFSSPDATLTTYEKIHNASPQKVLLFPSSSQDLFFALEAQEQKNTFSGWVYLIIIIALLLLAFLFAYLITYILYLYIERICALVSNPFSKSKNTDINEFTYVSSHISQLVLNNESVKNELSNKLIQLNDAQATALQLQISPHFLFNTLNLINSVALSEIKRDSKITNIVDLLSNMLYTILDTSNLVCTLENEIKYSNEYIQIQKYKYSNIDVIWNIPADKQHLPIVKFTLQPILENAIHYGITSGKKRIITITGREVPQKNIYEIEVHDNGTGITETEAIKINTKINDEHKPIHSIGLWNTNRRLSLLLGPEYGCKIVACTNGGTSVFITIPLTS